MKSDTQAKSLRFVCGVPFPAEWPDLLCHLQLFLKAPELQKNPENLIANGKPCIYTGEGRFHHSKTISKILWPKSFEWHNWATKIDRAACESDYLCVTGCGASSKSTTIGGYALKFWMAAPLETGVLIASKTIDNSKKRIWREV